MSTSTSRRNFCKLVGLATASAASAGVAASAVANEAQAAHLAGYTEVNFSKETEVLVIGAGPGGLMCAYETAVNGLQTILADKHHYVGGLARVSAGVQNFFGSKYGNEMRGAALYEDMDMSGFHARKKRPELAEQYSIYSGKVQDLIGYEFGYEWNPPYGDPALDGMWIPKGGLGETWVMIDVIKDNVVAAGAELFLDNKCTNLILDQNDEVIGARFENYATGEVTDIKAEYIVLSTGGFISNQNLVAEYMPDWTIIGCVTVGDDGDGIVLGQKVGGQFEGASYINLNSHDEAIFVAQMFGPSISVLPNGKRFYCETSCHQGPIGCYNAGCGNWWAIWDDTLDKGPDAEIIHTADDKRIVANTVEELAEGMGIDPRVLQDTFDEWAEICKNQEDPQFGRKLFLTELKPPYYALNNRPVRYKSRGGLAVDLNAQMLDANEQPIPHMFCAGMVGLADYSSDLVPSLASGMFCGTRISVLAGKLEDDRA